MSALTNVGRRINWPGIAVIAVVIVIWQIAATVGPLAEMTTVPSVTETITGFGDLWAANELIPPVLYTLGVALLSAAIGIVAGGVIGTLLGLFAPFRLFTQSSFDVLRTIPVTAIMPVLLLLLGAEARTEIIAASIAATWPMLVNTADGIRSIHPRLDEVGRMFGFSRLKRVFKLTIPAAMPSLLVGGRLAAVTSLIAVIIAEMIIVPEGIGWALLTAQHALQNGQMWALVIVCGWLGWLFSLGLTALVNRLQPGGAK